MGVIEVIGHGSAPGRTLGTKGERAHNNKADSVPAEVPSADLAQLNKKAQHAR